MLSHVGGLVGTSRIPSRACPIIPRQGITHILLDRFVFCNVVKIVKDVP